MRAIIEVGRQLQQAFADCNRGEWGELTGRTIGKSLLPFGYLTAYRLKRIATNTALSNVSHGQHLPSSWRTLAELADLDANDIEARDKAAERVGVSGSMIDRAEDIVNRSPRARWYLVVRRG